MRKNIEKQMPLMPPKIDHPQAEELNAISCILDRNPIIYDLAMQDLSCKNRKSKAGAKGMTAEQVVRAAIIKQMFEFSYTDLAFHLVDSVSMKRFCLIGIADKGFKKSVLCKNIKAISPETWEAINRCLVGFAKDADIEKGREVRIDCTVVESNIHKPFDSTLLWDSVRVLARILKKAKDFFPRSGIRFQNHTRRAKRRMLSIQYAKNKKQRKSHYLDLLKVARCTVDYARNAIDFLQHNQDSISIALSNDLKQTVQLALRVIDQTERRILHGRSVPASEKVVSIFEPHTDIIVKDSRDTLYPIFREKI